MKPSPVRKNPTLESGKVATVKLPWVRRSLHADGLAREILLVVPMMPLSLRATIAGGVSEILSEKSISFMRSGVIEIDETMASNFPPSSAAMYPVKARSMYSQIIHLGAERVGDLYVEADELAARIGQSKGG